MIPQLEELYWNARILFVQQGCSHCKIWKNFIARINLELPIEKRIIVQDMTNIDKFSAPPSPLIELFDKKITNLPVLFFDGNRIDGAHSRIEAEAFIRAALRKDFLMPKDNPYIFDRECRIEKKMFKKEVIICN